MPSRISIIIPALNESDYLERTLAPLVWDANCEIIVADGGSSDGTDEVAVAAGARLIRAAPGRARQLNEGAGSAAGDVLLFLHADTLVPPQFGDLVRAALASEQVVGGAFQLHIDGSQRSLRLIEWGANLRSRWRRMPYGDQGLFVKTETFDQLGGFRELPIMEDYEFVRRLRRQGRIVLLNQPITTSARRWETLGPWNTTWINQLVILGYHLGVSPQRLASWYRHPTKFLSGCCSRESPEARVSHRDPCER